MQKTNSGKDGYKKTKLGLIPEDWSTPLFSEIAKRKKDKLNPKNDSSSNFKCIELEHIESETGRLLGYTDSETQKSTKNKFELNNILFGKLRPYLKKYWYAEFDGVCSSEIWVLENKTGIKSKYLYYFVQSNRFISAANVTTGTKMPRADWDYLSGIRFPIPPIAKQNKITEILSTWDKAIKTLELLIAKKEKLKKGLMQQLLTGKKRFPGFEEKWEERKLGECIIGKGDYGINAPSTSFSEDLPVYLRITDIDDRGKFSKENKTSVDDENYTDYLLEEGDIVFARTGNTTGKTYLYDNRDGELVYAGFLIRFKPDPNILLPKFLKYYTDTHRYWYWVSVMSARSGQPGINSTEYSKLTFKVPPVEEQKKIIETIDHVYSDITQLGHLKEKFQYQKKGLMQQLLMGKTRVEVQSN